eukprot:gb/GEZN01001901.1/.p1 GENE.gb/GEZN01001901.1/~~gb/GEZN01001901.1/.p1  ORF type:complete len:861 (-),score=56.14 gb/GEZN01001901.1/:112-2694(-)
MAHFDYVALHDQPFSLTSRILSPVRVAAGLMVMGLTGFVSERIMRFSEKEDKEEREMYGTGGSFLPKQGLDVVRVRPGPPGPLQAAGAQAKNDLFLSCLFSYGTWLSDLAQPPKAFLEGSTSVPGWVYGASPNSVGNLGHPTGKIGDILKGSIMCWPFTTFPQKLQMADKLRGYNPYNPNLGTVCRDVVAAVTADGSVKKCYWYYQSEPPGWLSVSQAVDVDVLVVGAGPTGLAAASEAMRHGLTVRLIDQASSRAIISKALVMHARTLEALEGLEPDRGLSKRLVLAGTELRAVNINIGAPSLNSSKPNDPSGPRRVRVDLSGLDWGDTRYPFWLSLTQWQTEQELEKHLWWKGVQVQWNVALASLSQEEKYVQAVLSTGEAVRSRYLVGADGGRSTTASLVRLGMVRPLLNVVLILADFKTTCPELLDIQNEGRIYKSPKGVVLLVPMPTKDQYRLIADLPGQVKPNRNLTIGSDMLDAIVKQRAGLRLGSYAVTWTSQVALSEGVRDKFRKHRVFLAGDAAHITSPVGGQGMNTGIQDAHNLMWKLALAKRLDKEAGLKNSGIAEAYLASYEEERRPTAKSMVARTGFATGMLMSDNKIKSFVLKYLASPILQQRFVQQTLGRTLGMLEIAYPLNEVLFSLHTGSRAAWPAHLFPTGWGRRVPNPIVMKGMEASNADSIRLHDLFLQSGRSGHSLILFQNATEAKSQSCKVVVGMSGTTPDIYQMFASLVTFLASGDVLSRTGQDTVASPLFEAANNLFQTLPLDSHAEKVLRDAFNLEQDGGVVLVRPDLVVAGVWPPDRLLEVGAAGTGSGSLSLLSILLGEGISDSMHVGRREQLPGALQGLSPPGAEAQFPGR